ncbi:hypothetical protein DIPPA_34674 [Diplonema papillatum]|nr:hypothetical protein DIPPA_34674 [Diplonema papillatum]
MSDRGSDAELLVSEWDDDRAIVDVRSMEAYSRGHLPGSGWLPGCEVKDRMYELPETAVKLLLVAENAEEGEALVKVLRDARWDAVGCLWEVASRRLGLEGIATGNARRRLWKPSPVLEEFAGTVESELNALKTGPFEACDVGCGHGRDLAFLASRGWRVSGADNRAVLLEHARDLCLRETDQKEPNPCRTVAEDLYKSWPFESDSFDLLVVVRFRIRPVLEHVKAAIRPGGYLVYSYFADANMPKNGIAYDDVKQFFCDSGDFEVVIDRETTIPDGRKLNDFIARRRAC